MLGEAFRLQDGGASVPVAASEAVDEFAPAFPWIPPLPRPPPAPNARPLPGLPPVAVESMPPAPERCVVRPDAAADAASFPDELSWEASLSDGAPLLLKAGVHALINATLA